MRNVAKINFGLTSPRFSAIFGVVIDEHYEVFYKEYSQMGKRYQNKRSPRMLTAQRWTLINDALETK
jgi:hypothetical protein